MGISSGANLLGAIDRAGRGWEPRPVVATVLPDDNKKYLSTDLLHEEPVEDGYVSTGVTLLSYRSIRRSCHTCCDPSACSPPAPPGFVADDEPLPACPRSRGQR